MCIRFYIHSISIFTYINIRIYIKYWKRIHISIYIITLYIYIQLYISISIYIKNQYKKNELRNFDILLRKIEQLKYQKC